MSYQQGAEGGAITKERQKDGSPNKDLDETMDPDMSVHVHKTDFSTPSCESTRTLESDGELSNNLKHLQHRTASHSDHSDQSVNLSVDPSNGDQSKGERVHLERPVSPTPSYLSMKSDKSMLNPPVFKEEDLTQKEGVLLESAESPTLSDASANSHQSMDTDEEDSAQKEKNNLKHLQLCTASHMSMSDHIDQSVNLSIDPSDDGDQTKDESIIRPEEVVCDVCEVKAVKFCQTCTLSYCGTHVKKHYTVPKLQRHTLVEVTGDLEERLCQEHHRALEVFCRTDQKLICSLCEVSEHEGHDIVYDEIKQAGRQTFDRDQCQRLRLASVDEVLPPPGEIQFSSVTSDSVSLSWGSADGLTGAQKFRVTWGYDGEERSLRVEDGCNVEIDGLQPGKKYQFSVATEGEDGRQSRWVSASVYTVVPAPRDLQINQSGAT